MPEAGAANSDRRSVSEIIGDGRCQTQCFRVRALAGYFAGCCAKFLNR
jgi:hypothetical protein